MPLQAPRLTQWNISHHISNEMDEKYLSKVSLCGLKCGSGGAKEAGLTFIADWHKCCSIEDLRHGPLPFDQNHYFFLLLTSVTSELKSTFNFFFVIPISP